MRNEQAVDVISVASNKRGKIIWGVSIGVFGLIVLAGIAGIIAYSLSTQAKKPFTFLATSASSISLSQLSVPDFVTLVTAPNSANPQPLVTASFSGN
jgi:hypothetical protein